MISPRRVWTVAERDIVVNKMLRPDVQLVVGGNYFNFYAAGIIATMLYSAAIFIGYDIYEEADHGVIEYLLSVPVSRKELVLGRSIGGGLRSFVYVTPLLLFVLYLIGISSPFQLLVALASLFLFSFGVTGLSITLAIGIKSSDRFDILLGILDALIVRLSTALYPIAYMPSYYAGLAKFNPLTFAADLFRWGAGIESALLTSPGIAAFGIVLFFSIFTFLGIFLHERRLEGGSWQ